MLIINWFKSHSDLRLSFFLGKSKVGVFKKKVTIFLFLLPDVHGLFFKCLFALFFVLSVIEKSAGKSRISKDLVFSK